MFGPKWRLLLIGAGQLPQAVAQIAAMLDFEVLVCDPREEYAVSLGAGINGIRRIEGMPDDVVRELMPDVHTAIVALTHDPKLDDMALLEALQSNVFYVGAGDLPLLQSNTLRAVAAALSGHDVVVPVHCGQRGHPVGFHAKCGPGRSFACRY